MGQVDQSNPPVFHLVPAPTLGWARGHCYRPVGAALVFSLALLVAGCAVDEQGPSTRPVTTVDKEQATVAYWLAKPATASVAHADYDALWRAIEAVLQPAFAIDRSGYRSGVLSTEPAVSGQFFEFWRQDTVTPESFVESSVATVRRRVQFTIERRGSKFVAEPRVVVERQAYRERQLLTARRPMGAFAEKTDMGSREADAAGDDGIQEQDGYWYAAGRDHELEQSLVDRVRARLR